MFAGMSLELARLETPEERELSHKQRELSGLRAELAQQELDLATLRAELNVFERHYVRVVGFRYAELDEVEACIAELLSQMFPDDPARQTQAAEARARANASARASKMVQEPAGHQSTFEPDDALKKLYREAAKSIHPDLAADEDDRVRRQRFMAEANQAYEAGDGARLQEILHEWANRPDAITGDGVAAELIRVIRQIARIRERLKAIEIAMEQLRSSELYRLHEEVKKVEADGGDLLAEMASRLDQKIADARERLAGLREQANHV